VLLPYHLAPHLAVHATALALKHGVVGHATLHAQVDKVFAAALKGSPHHWAVHHPRASSSSSSANLVRDGDPVLSLSLVEVDQPEALPEEDRDHLLMSITKTVGILLEKSSAIVCAGIAGAVAISSNIYI
jgi:hypothetical protein